MIHGSQLILALCAGVVAGVGVAEGIPALSLVVALIVCVIAILGMVFAHPIIAVSSAFLCGLVLGTLRQQLVMTFDVAYDTQVTVEATIVREPELQVANQRITVSTSEVHGLIQLKTPLHPRWRVGDVLRITCTLQQPEAFDGFAYDKYLQRYGVSSICSYPSVEYINHQQSFHALLFALKRHLVMNTQQVLAGPEHTLVLGVVLGLTGAVPPALLDAFRTTGTSHVLVISGSNVTVMVAVLTQLFVRIGLSRRSVLWVMIPVLVLYVIITGIQPSATRAAVFGGVVLFAEYIGRKQQALRLLLYVSVAMIVVNPLLLRYDAGFQLSVGATVGLILFQQWTEARLRWVPAAAGLRATLAATCSASLTTVPIIAYGFHTFSPVGYVANIFLVPVMDVVMVYGMILVLVSPLFHSIVTLLSLPLYYLLHLSIALVEMFARVPYATVALPNFHWLFVLLFYIHLGLAALWLHLRKEQQLYE